MEEQNLTFRYRLLRKFSLLFPATIKYFFVPKSISSNKTIYIKLPTPFWSIAKYWGDYHLAIGLKKQFEKQNFKVVLHCKNEWHKKHKSNSLILVLRGLYEYSPRDTETNFMWNISHPGEISINEYKGFDRVFIASAKKVNEVTPNFSTKVYLLDQCTDTDVFFPLNQKRDIPLLFVGNTRGEYREVVKTLIEAEKDVTVVGQGWDKFIDPKYILKDHVKNNELNNLYNRANIILNDHWEDMKTEGFVSNRISDALASGAKVISDKPEGNLSRFDKFDNLYFYNSKDELIDIVNTILDNENKNTDLKQLKTFESVTSEILKHYEAK